MGRRKRTTTGPRAGAKNKKSAASRPPNSVESVEGYGERIVAGRETGESESQDSNSFQMPVTVSGHKNFGKFRCLADKTHIADICTDGCAAVGNVEVKIVDPCASSESENSNSTELPSVSDAPSQRCFAKAGRNSESNSPISFKSLRTKLLEKLNCENKINIERRITLGDVVPHDTQLPDPMSSIITCNDPRRNFTSTISCLGDSFTQIPKTETNPGDDADDKKISFENFKESIENSNGDEETFTVLKILEENVAENVYVEPDANFCLFSESSPSPAENSSAESMNVDENPAFDESDEATKRQRLDKDIMDSIKDFETRISNLLLSSRSKKSNASNNAPGDSPPNKARTVEDKKLEEIANASESCSTPTSVMSEEDANYAIKSEAESVTIEKAEPVSNCSTDSSSSSVTGIRRSNRIKTINVLKQRSRGRGLVKIPPKSFSLIKEITIKNQENCNENVSKTTSDKSASSSTVSASQNQPTFSVPSVDLDNKPVKVKSRWRRSSEMEMGSRSPITPPLCSPNMNHINNIKNVSATENPSTDAASTNPPSPSGDAVDPAIRERLNQFKIISENEYHCDRAISKEARKMTCECFLTKEEIDRGELGCGDDCLNRLLMIECNSRCPVGDRCTNRRFQSHQYSDLRVIKTEKKGLGIEAKCDIPRGEFLMEYVGEVLNWEQFGQRAQEYSSDKNTHHYFMSLKSDAIIDATLKGNISRFINHSCDPNAETQKWTVNGDLRIGFFSKKDIKAGEEVTFDYQFQRYGKEGLRCFCEASNCRGWIGEEPDSSEEEDESETTEIKIEIENDAKEETSKHSVLGEIKDKNVEEVKIKQEKETFDKAESNIHENEKTEAVIQDTTGDNTETKRKVVTRKKRSKENRFNQCNDGLRKDMEVEEDVKLLSHSGVKNQSHTLTLCRAMVRAKHDTVRISLLKLLKNADLPCRRLFLDYRGLRLLSPWCDDVDDNFKLQMLTVLEKLPIPNKTILKESKILMTVEKWMTDTSPNKEDSDESRPGTPVLIDENTGLPTNNTTVKMKKTKTETSNQEDKKIVQKSIHKLSKQLMESWSSLQEVFKIPKKERIELMKEHERQANEVKPTDNISLKQEERWEDRYNRPEREKKRTSNISTIERRNLKEDRILAAVPPMSKEERRRVFAAREAHREQLRRVQTIQNISVGSNVLTNQWTQNTDNSQNIPINTYQNVALTEVTSQEYPMTEYVQPEYMQVDYTSSEYMQPAGYQYPYCTNQQVYPSVNPAIHPPPVNYGYNYSTSPYSNTYPTNNQTHPVPSYQNVPILSESPRSNSATAIVPPHQISSIPTINSEISNQNIQPIPTLTSQYSYNANDPLQNNTVPYYQQPLPDSTMLSNEFIKSEPVTAREEFTSDSTVDSANDVVPWTPVRLPSGWRSMKDPRGRTYYYHVKFRIPQWEPPLYSPTLHSDEDDSEEDDEEEEAASEEDVKIEPEIKNEIADITMDESYGKMIEGINGICEAKKIENVTKKNGVVKKMHNFTQKVKKNRPLLVTERIISPRQEEDKINAKLDLKRYKENKEKLRRRKELALAASGVPDALNKYKKRAKTSKHKASKEKDKPIIELDEKTVRRIKETFRASMARVMVHHLDPYRRDDCAVGRITNTADFKHLARKLTHFVMLKELKHCQTVNDLECNDSVKQKAKEFVRKYMAKYGSVYVRPPDEVE